MGRRATAPALALIAALAGCGTGDAATSESDGAAPPDGTRWVGMGRVVVAVPEWWTTGETQCGAPVEDTVYFDTTASYDCEDPVDPATVREVSALAVLDGTRGYGAEELHGMKPVGNVVERSGCEGWFDGVCRRLFAVPGEDTVFAVTIAEDGDGDYEAIRDSARVLPEHLTTVPLATSGGWTPTWGAEPSAVAGLRAALRRAGLETVVETVEPPSNADAGSVADLPVGSLLSVSPGLGSVIEVGGTVTVMVMGG